MAEATSVLKLVLDADKGIEIKSTDAITVPYQTFRQNILGLNLLAQTVRAQEIHMMQTSNSLFRYDADSNPEFPTLFNWFSLTFNNHLRQIALVELMQERGWTAAELLDKDNAQATKEHCTDYAKSVDADLYRWRNKAAAHSAATDPAIRRDASQSDTQRLLEQSVWINLVYQAPYYTIGNMQPQGMLPAEGLPIWALTEKFERHRARFWPTYLLPKIPPPPKPQETAVRFNIPKR